MKKWLLVDRKTNAGFVNEYMSYIVRYLHAPSIMLTHAKLLQSDILGCAKFQVEIAKSFVINKIK